jgi:hypothetical protein
VVFKEISTVKKFLDCDETINIEGHEVNIKLFLDERDF